MISQVLLKGGYQSKSSLSVTMLSFSVWDVLMIQMVQVALKKCQMVLFPLWLDIYILILIHGHNVVGTLSNILSSKYFHYLISLICCFFFYYCSLLVFFIKCYCNNYHDIILYVPPVCRIYGEYFLEY